MEKENGFSDKAIMRALYKLVIYETPAELEAILIECPELLTEQALEGIRMVIAQTPKTEPIREVWENREIFLTEKIKLENKKRNSRARKIEA